MDYGFLEPIAKMDRETLAKEALVLNNENIAFLVGSLCSKEDSIRYPALLLLQERCLQTNDVYPYWEIFAEKLNSENSYQRSIGLMLIARNTKWDMDNKINNVIKRYLELCDDEKPVTVRQCIQSMLYILPYKPALYELIAEKLLSIDLSLRKETQRKILQKDIISVLLEMQKAAPDEKIRDYIEAARAQMDRKTRNELFGE